MSNEYIRIIDNFFSLFIYELHEKQNIPHCRNKSKTKYSSFLHLWIESDSFKIQNVRVHRNQPSLWAMVGILLIGEKLLHNRINSLRVNVWTHETSLLKCL
jgi:hypothetical protein